MGAAATRASPGRALRSRRSRGLPRLRSDSVTRRRRETRASAGRGAKARGSPQRPPQRPAPGARGPSPEAAAKAAPSVKLKAVFKVDASETHGAARWAGLGVPGTPGAATAPRPALGPWGDRLALAARPASGPPFPPPGGGLRKRTPLGGAQAAQAPSAGAATGLSRDPAERYVASWAQTGDRPRRRRTWRDRGKEFLAPAGSPMLFSPFEAFSWSRGG